MSVPGRSIARQQGRLLSRIGYYSRKLKDCHGKGCHAQGYKDTIAFCSAELGRLQDDKNRMRAQYGTAQDVREIEDEYAAISGIKGGYR